LNERHSLLYKDALFAGERTAVQEEVPELSTLILMTVVLWINYVIINLMDKCLLCIVDWFYRYLSIS